MLQRVSKARQLILDEVPVGDMNGSNYVFTTASNFQPNELVVYYNGIKLKEGSNNDFEVTGSNEFTMLYAPQFDDVLSVTYFIE